MVPILITVKFSVYISTETPRNKTRPTTQIVFVIYLQLSTFVGNLHRDRAIIQPAISSAVDSNSLNESCPSSQEVFGTDFKKI